MSTLDQAIYVSGVCAILAVLGNAEHIWAECKAWWRWQKLIGWIGKRR